MGLLPINVYNRYGNVVLCYKVVIIMDFGVIEENNNVLRKVIKYLDGDVKIVVEKRIKDNFSLIDQFFDDYAKQMKSIEQYEQQ